MLKLEEEPPLQSAKNQALGLPPQGIREPGHRVHLLVVIIHILLMKPALLPRQLEQAVAQVSQLAVPSLSGGPGWSCNSQTHYVQSFPEQPCGYSLKNIHMHSENVIMIKSIAKAFAGHHSCNRTSHLKMYTLSKTLRSNSNPLAIFISAILFWIWQIQGSEATRSARLEEVCLGAEASERRKERAWYPRSKKIPKRERNSV